MEVEDLMGRKLIVKFGVGGWSNDIPTQEQINWNDRKPRFLFGGASRLYFKYLC